METKEFSELLVNARKQRGLSRYALGLQMRVSDAHLRRIELSLNNYGLDKIFDYLNAIDCKLFLSSRNKTIELQTIQECVQWIIDTRKNKTRYWLAKNTGLGIHTIENIEEGKTTARIDTFLKIIEVLGYKVDKIC